ncbi:MAG: arylesterase [Gammaproteobacteria bacterium]|nr:arylesterase [Gammaproteobacteria bacterium]NVK88702.1 arylesterase [Gammaproteobacteria bacterium]
MLYIFARALGKQLILTTLLLALVSCSNDKTLSPLSQSDIILAFGDSLTYGTGAARENSYPAVLANLTNLTVINSGIPGDTTDDGLNRIASVLEQEQPRLVLLCLGGNDFLRKKSSQSIAANLTALISEIQSSGAEVVLIAVPKPAIFLSDADLYEEVARQHNIPLLSHELTDLLSEDDFKSDAIHLNAAGYEKLAEQVHQFLIEQGAL